MLEQIIALISTGSVGGVIAWIVARKKNNAEALSVELENVKTAIEIWRKVAEELGAKCEALTIKCSDLTKEIDKYRGENLQLSLELKELKKTLNNHA